MLANDQTRVDLLVAVRCRICRLDSKIAGLALTVFSMYHYCTILELGVATPIHSGGDSIESSLYSVPAGGVSDTCQHSSSSLDAKSVALPNTTPPSAS